MRRNVPCRLCVAAFLLLLAAIVGAVVVRADEDAAAASRSRQELQPGSDERNQGVDSVAALQSDQSGDSEWDGADSDSPLDSGDVVGELVDEDEEDKDEEDEDDDDYASIDYRSILASAAENLTEAARRATNAMSESVSARLEVLFRQANSSECRASIAEHLGYFVQSVGGEKSMPFAEWQMESECPEPSLDWDHLPEGMHIGHLQNKSYQPEDGEYKNATDLRLLYGILTHDDAAATVRLLTVLNDTNVKFVVHVDGKHVETQDALLRFALAHGNVHILPDDRRVRINWGGFTMVNATLQLLQYALLETSLAHHALSDFDKFVHLASTSYPLASNREIKERLAQFPIDANLLYAVMKPARPKPWGWHYFVECDDRLHRIHRLSPWQNSTHGVDLYTSSQWFMLSREFALHLAAPPPGSFVDLFLQYARHVVVADETFFGTALLHSPYCAKHHNANFLHLQFDRWESVLPQDKRDPKKCMMLDPNHCGRSPTVMTIDNVDLLELSPDLFARKVRAPF
jgi:Core-2/I-Branching enzyme